MAVHKCYLLQLPGGDYVGITGMTMQNRLKFHRRSTMPIGHAIRKYGEPCVLFLGFGTRSEMIKQERREIAVRKPKYNLTAGGEGFSSEEMRAYWQDDKFRERAIKGMRRSHQRLSDQDRAKLGERLTSLNRSPERRAAQSKRMREFWANPANRQAHGDRVRKHDPA